MPDELTRLDPEAFLRLAVQRGGLTLDHVVAGLSPEAAKALQFIASSSRDTGRSIPNAPMTGKDHDAVRGVDLKHSPETEPAKRSHEVCGSCGHVPVLGDKFCRKCGRPLAGLGSPMTLADLVAQGKLSPEQAEEARNALLAQQRSYPAGTRYSIFGSSATSENQPDRQAGPSG